MQSSHICSGVVKKLGLVDLHVVSVGWGKHITEESVLDYIQRLKTSGKYDLVIEATPLGLLKELMEDKELSVPPSLEDYVHKCVVKECTGIGSQWGGVILPFLDTALAYVLHNKLSPHAAASSVLGTRVAVVSIGPYSPSCEFSPDAKQKLLDITEECCAYVRGNLPTRGGDCGRWGTRLVPEGFSYVLSSVVGPGWRACELPGNGAKCVMVVLPDISLVQFFKMGNGRRIGGTLSSSSTPKRLTDVSAFECIFDIMTNKASVYDCSIANGRDMRQQCLSLRIKEATDILSGCFISSSSDEEAVPVTVVQYTPPITVVDKTAAARVLFVKDAAPLGTHPGGDAYAWKAPTLKEGMYVLTCRVGECMAAAARGGCLLRKVGRLLNPKETEHMKTYVCEPVSASGSRKTVWKALRLAKNSERLFTVDECFADEYPHTQITRGGMVKLLTQISPGGSRTLGHSAAPKKQSAAPVIQKRPAVDKDGWIPAPIGTPSPAPAAQKKKPVDDIVERNAFWALQSDDDGDDVTTRKKKK